MSGIPTMSQFASKDECRKAREEWYESTIVELLTALSHYSSANCQPDNGDMADEMLDKYKEFEL